MVINIMMLVFALLVIFFLIQYRAYQSCQIKVIYENNTHGRIKKNRLEEFVASGSITKFFRSSGWVTIGVDPVSVSNQGHLIERRE